MRDEAADCNMGSLPRWGMTTKHYLGAGNMENLRLLQQDYPIWND